MVAASGTMDNDAPGVAQDIDNLLSIERDDTATKRCSINKTWNKSLREEKKETRRRSETPSDLGSRKCRLRGESSSRSLPKGLMASGVNLAGSPDNTQHKRFRAPDDTPSEVLEQSGTHRLKSTPEKCSASPANPPCELLKQPEMRPISQEQLVAEVKGIYAGLVMVENKCIEVDEAQNTETEASKLDGKQYQALIALHRTLLHEHHDFFLASQHPSANSALKKPAAKYATQHVIPGFPLYDTVPAFDDMWVERLGDLGRYRMAIEEDNAIRDREVWTGVSRLWYSRASNPLAARNTAGSLPHPLLPATTLDPITAASSSPRRKATSNLTLSRRFQRNLHTLLLFLPHFLLSLLPLAAATHPHEIPHRTAKILLTSLSALTSLSSGMTSLQLPNPSALQEVPRSQLTKPALRIACSISLAFLVVGYTLWFLNIGGGGGGGGGREARRKKRAFLVGFWVCIVFCWAFVRPAVPPASAAVPGSTAGTGAGAGAGGGGKGGDDGFVWLDGVNLFGLVAVVVGILNAEGSLFGALFSSGSSSSGGGQAQGEEDGDGGDGEGDGRDGRRRMDEDEEEIQVGGRRRRVADDEENQNPGGGRREDGEDSGDVGLRVLSLASHVFGA